MWLVGDREESVELLYIQSYALKALPTLIYVLEGEIPGYHHLNTVTLSVSSNVSKIR